MNAYMLYSNAIRADVKAANPDFSMGEIVSTYKIIEISNFLRTMSNISNPQAKEIGSRYKSITDEEKAKWQAKADKAKDVYKKEMKDYENNKPGDSPSKAKSEGKKKKKPEPESDSDSDDSDADDSDESE